MDSTHTPKPARTREEIRAEITRLNKLRDETKDPDIREDLGDAISALGMGALFNKIEDERDD